MTSSSGEPSPTDPISDMLRPNPYGLCDPSDHVTGPPSEANLGFPVPGAGLGKVDQLGSDLEWRMEDEMS